MTAEQRTLIELKDIVGIELKCKCGSTVRFALLKMQPQVFKGRQHECPNCKDRLADAPDTNRIGELAEALSVLIKGDTTAKIRLEIDGDDNGTQAKAR